MLLVTVQLLYVYVAAMYDHRQFGEEHLGDAYRNNLLKNIHNIVHNITL